MSLTYIFIKKYYHLMTIVNQKTKTCSIFSCNTQCAVVWELFIIVTACAGLGGKQVQVYVCAKYIQEGITEADKSAFELQNILWSDFLLWYHSFDIKIKVRSSFLYCLVYRVKNACKVSYCLHHQTSFFRHLSTSKNPKNYYIKTNLICIFWEA